MQSGRAEPSRATGSRSSSGTATRCTQHHGCSQHGASPLLQTCNAPHRTQQLHIFICRAHLVHPRRQQLDQRGVLAAALHRVPLRTAEEGRGTGPAGQCSACNFLGKGWFNRLAGVHEWQGAAPVTHVPQNNSPHLRPVVEAALQLHVVAAVRPHNDCRHQLGLRRPAAAGRQEGRAEQLPWTQQESVQSGSSLQGSTAHALGCLLHMSTKHMAARPAALLVEMEMRVWSSPRKLALPIDAAAAAVLIAARYGLHRHLRAVGQRRTRHRGRAAVVAAGGTPALVVGGRVAAAAARPRLALRLALRRERHGLAVDE